MDLKQIKELMVAMERSGTRRLVLKEKQFELVLEREEKDQLPNHYPSNCQLSEGGGERDNTYDRANQALSRGAEMPTALAAAASKNEPNDKNQLFITSPMVGTFYTGPSPESPPFVKVGDKIEKGTLVCVIEAMKVMNEVKAGVSGTIVEVLTDNADPVEFGTKLFRVG